MLARLIIIPHNCIILTGRHHADKKVDRTGVRIMLYFVKENKLHRFPLPRRCGEKYEKEALRDTIPHGVEECPYCLHRWPGEDE